MLRLIHSDEGFSNRLTNIPSIFLAGPSPRGYGAGFPADWRDEAIPIFENKGFHGRLFLPRPTSGNSTNYDGQIEWELHHLEIADTIMFWIPRKSPDMKGLTTNVEFGFYLKSHRIAYGRPDWAEQTRYLDHLYAKFLNKKPQNTLEDTIDEAIRMSIANVI